MRPNPIKRLDCTMMRLSGLVPWSDRMHPAVVTGPAFVFVPAAADPIALPMSPEAEL